MSLAREPQSRFRLSEAIIRNNIETFGLMKKFPFLDPNNVDDRDTLRIVVTPEQAGRPWMIADQVYNSPMLDWVVVLFNKPLNPINWPAPGIVIKLPNQSLVLPNV